MRQKGRLFPPIPKLTQRNVRPDAAIGQIRPIQTRQCPIYACTVVVGTTAVGALRELQIIERPGHSLGDSRQLGGQETDAEIRPALPQAHGARGADHRDVDTSARSQGRHGRGRRQPTPVGLRRLPVLYRQAVQGGVGHQATRSRNISSPAGIPVASSMSLATRGDGMRLPCLSRQTWGCEIPTFSANLASVRPFWARYSARVIR